MSNFAIGDHIPRFHLLHSVTPIQRLSNLEKHLGDERGGANFFVKRDDCGLIGGGGNKLRKLEFLLGQAIAEGADTVITVGGLQSNHARLTAAAAALAGLKCELVLTKQVPRHDRDYERNGNVMLYDLFGAILNIFPGSVDAHQWAQQRCGELRAAGRRVYFIPSGGSSPLGALGYARSAEEILSQEKEMGIKFSRILVPNGSAGTHAGLAAGYAAAGRSPHTVRSYAVLSERDVSAKKTLDLTNAALTLLNSNQVVEQSDIDVDGKHRGPGYGAPTSEMKTAVRIVARTEGILLDPVYSGKAFAGMLFDARTGSFNSGENILFVMTGGTPGLFAYRSAFED